MADGSLFFNFVNSFCLFFLIIGSECGALVVVHTRCLIVVTDWGGGDVEFSCHDSIEDVNSKLTFLRWYIPGGAVGTLRSIVCDTL